jgi:hypothetical protein
MTIIRNAFFPKKGNQLFEVDFKRIEVAISCAYNEDPNLIRYVSDPSTDMHGDMAQQIFKLNKFDKHLPSNHILRQAAKNGFVFPQFYGDYYVRCAENICEWVKLPIGNWKLGMGIKLDNGTHISDHLIKKGIKTFGSIGDYRSGKSDTGFVKHLKEIENDFWNNRFSKYKWWKDTIWDIYQKYGQMETKTGFVCSGLMSKNSVTNYPIQGSAFHCLLWSLIQIDNEIIKRNLKTKIIGQIHDAIIFDVYPPELDEIAILARKVTCEDLPKAWDWINVPLFIEAEVCPIDGSWVEKEEYKFLN